MPSLFARVFRRKNNEKERVPTLKLNGAGLIAEQNRVVVTQADPWERKVLKKEEVVDLLRACCDELKARGLDQPLFLLPFRPSSDINGTKQFIRRYFAPGPKVPTLTRDILAQELRLTEILVVAGVVRWILSRLTGGIVGWDCYELFRIAEHDLDYPQDSFSTMIPLCSDSETHASLIILFFSFLASVAAHAKSNGFAGQRLARIAGWWAFECEAGSGGFGDGYASWERAADATEHLFLAYLRSVSPQAQYQALPSLPLSLSNLLQQSAYPPRPSTSHTTASIAAGASSILRITLSVQQVSPTPFALLDRLARHSFVQTNPNEKGDALEALIEGGRDEGDPTKALTTECLRVLRLISAANESGDAVTATLLRTPQSLEDKAWTRFTDLGFEGLASNGDDDSDDDFSRAVSPEPGFERPSHRDKRSRRAEYLDANRPKTPSWGDFLVSGFQGGSQAATFSLPPDKLLPPINVSTSGNQNLSTVRRGLNSSEGGPRKGGGQLYELEKGEVKSVERLRIDDALWSVWIESLAGEGMEQKKAVFGRCVIAETKAKDTGRRWIIVEEIVKGAEAGPELLPPLLGVGKKMKTTKRKKDKLASIPASTLSTELPVEKKRDSKRRSASDLIGRLRAQQMLEAEKRGLNGLKPISENHIIDNSFPSRPRRNSIDTIRVGRPNTAFGMDVSRAMKWADSYDNYPGDILVSRPPLPPLRTASSSTSVPQAVTSKTVAVERRDISSALSSQISAAPVSLAPTAAPPSAPESLTTGVNDTGRNLSTPVPSILETKSQEPLKGPVLLEPVSHSKKQVFESPPTLGQGKKSPQSNMLKKFFGGSKERDDKAKKKISPVSPLPPSPVAIAASSAAMKTLPKKPSPITPPPEDETFEKVPPSLPSATRTEDSEEAGAVREWENDFDGTHREPVDSTTTSPIKRDQSKYGDDPVAGPKFEDLPSLAETINIPDVDTADLERWAAIRKQANERATRRQAGLQTDSSDDDFAVNVPKVRLTVTASNNKAKGRSKEEGDITSDEESVDARVARIRKRVQELTAGMDDD